MKFKKKDLVEIIDTNGELIGREAAPTSGSDLESAANKTSDTNARIGQQPFRYDMLGRFGFTLMPFMEGKENQGQTDLKLDLINLMAERYMEIMEYYYKNPNLLKSDYRKMKENTDDPKQKEHFETADKIISIVQEHFEKAFKEPETIDESSVVEDKVVDKKSEDEITNKSDDDEIKDKKLEVVAGLINKLDKKDKDKLKTLLERK